MRKREHRYSRKIRTIFLVICEGQTERAYVEALKRQYHLPIEIRTKVSGANVNARLIQSYINELGLDNKDDCQLFLMYDADVQAIINKLKTLGGHLIITNPCIELWFLLHVKSHHKSLSSAKIVDELKNSHLVWNIYEKGVLTRKQFEFLTENMATAISRAKQLTYGSNPSSNVPDFIDALEKAKNA